MDNPIAIPEEKNITQNEKDEKIKLYEECKQGLKHSRWSIFREFVNIGMYCATIEDNKLWQLEDFHRFDEWIADSDYGPGLSRRQVYNAMSVYRLGLFLTETHGINIMDWEDIGQYKMVILLPHLSAHCHDKEKVLALLHQGKSTLTAEMLKDELARIPRYDGIGRLQYRPNKVIIAELISNKAIEELDGKKVKFVIKERDKD